MATKYLLSWMAGKNRWRKRYKGRSYYFPKRDDETKEASYRRALLEWTAKRSDIDKVADVDPGTTVLKVLIARAERNMEFLRVQDVDTPANRERYLYHDAERDSYLHLLNNGVDITKNYTPAMITNPPDYLPIDIPETVVDVDPGPPWKQVEPLVPLTNTLSAQIEEFLSETRKLAQQGKRSVGRVETLRVGLNALSQVCGPMSPVVAVNTTNMLRLKKELEAAIDAGKLKPHTARDKLATAKQFAQWLWERELIELPRVLKSKSFSIPVGTKKIETFTDEELKRLVAAANGRTKLYLLLMLNCGMTQKDLADLKQSEVNWQLGRITRKRSKTKKWDDVPTVAYQLWPQTFALLNEHRSKNEELALTNEQGGPLKFERFAGTQMKKSDAVKSAYSRLIKKLAADENNPIVIAKPLKLFRKTAATRLGEHPTYSRFAQYFLGHAPESTADKFYVVPSAEQFDEAVKWLGTQLPVVAKS